MLRESRKAAKMSLLTAEKELGICRKTLVGGEYGEIELSPAVIAKMDWLYGAGGQLMRWHCGNMCTVGTLLGYQYVQMNPIIAGIKFLSALDKLHERKGILIDVLEDGVISPHEVPRMERFFDPARQLHLAYTALEIQKNKAACSNKRP